MATRSLWGSLLGRRGSNAEELPNEEMDHATQQGSRRSHSQVQTLCSMRTKPNTFGGSSSSSMSSTTNHASASGSDGSDSSPDPAAARPASNSMQLQSSQAPASAENGSSPFTAASGSNKAAGSNNSSHTTGAAADLAGSTPQLQDTNNPAAHDSASSTFNSSNSAGHMSRHSSSSNKALGPPAAAPAGPSAAHAEPSAPAGAAAATDAERTLSLSLGMSEHLSSSNALNGPDPFTAALPAPPQLPQQQEGSAGMSDMSFLPHPDALNPTGPFSSSAQQQPGLSTPNDSTTPRLSSPVAAADLDLFTSSPVTGLGSGLFGLGPQGPQSGQFGPAGSPFGGSGGGVGGAERPQSMEALMADLQATAGLTPEQAAAAASVMMQRMQPPPAPVHPLQSPHPPAHNPWTQSLPGFTSILGLNPAVPTSPMAHLHPGSNPDLGGFLVPGSPAAAAMGAFGGHLVGFDSVQSSSSNNVIMSGSGYAFPSAGAGGGGGDLLSPEASYLEEAAAYAHDGLDIPGTAQVAVHNVPFKWCNNDLEDLFKEQEGYLDAQLLFHENGRSKGVGVGLFRDRNCAVEACNKLSGAQADGRKLELVLMNPDNHVSFSCRQVAVLGLPWEYTSADVRALLEAAAEADVASPSDAGVEAVEVAYRDDGKSEGRAIATFASRRQAHEAIRRLHGKETLAGLRMRLFYLHEQQQTRNQYVLAQLRSQQQLVPGLLPGMMANLALGTDTPSPRHMPGLSGTPSGNVVRQLAFNNGTTAGNGDDAGSSPAEDGAGGAVGNGNGTAAGGGEGQGVKEGEGAGGGEGGAAGSQTGLAESRGGGTDEAPGSNRSSFDKDQGPVILHVSGLMESVTREQLRELFSQAGEVTKVDIPDGGRSMGYGFITFSNPQAAEQAMLLFNNYPLGGGAIHVAYSTSATAKARQQALRQARKATLGNSRVSNDGAGSRQPGTPRGLAAAAAGRRGPGVTSFPSNPSLGGLGSSFGALDPMQGLNPGRHSFDHPGYAPPQLGGGWPRGGPSGPMGPMGLSSSLGALGGTSPGMHAGAGMGLGRNRRPSFEYSLGGLTSPQMQMLAGAGSSAGYGPGGYGPGGGCDASTAGNLDQQLQILMQLTGTAGDSAFGAPAPGMLGGMGGAQPGTPPPAAGLRTGLGTPGAGGLFSAPMPGPGGPGLGGLGGPGGMSGLSTPPGQFPGASGTAGFFGGNPAASAAGQNVFSPSGLHAAGGLGGMGWGGLEVAGAGSAAQRHVLVTGLPPGLTENDLRTLFEVCGPLRAVSKQPDQDFAIITYDTLESARKAISALDGTQLPSGSTLSLQFTNLMPTAPETPAKTADMPWNPAASPAAGHGLYGAGPPGGPGFGTGLATPPRSSFTGDAAPGGALHSGSLFPLAESGNTGELFGGAFGGNVGGFSTYGGLGSVGSGLRLGASSPAFGKPPRDTMGSGVSIGPTAAAASSLFRSSSPGAVGISAGSPAGAVGRAGPAAGPGGLPPMYAATLGMSSSGSAGNLFGRAVGGDTGSGAGLAQGLIGRGRTGSSSSDTGSGHGSDGAGAGIV